MLYDYQKKFVSEIFTSLRTNNKVLAQLPTGGGKTFCFCYIAKKAIEGNRRILIMVHREELVGQTSRTLVKLGVPNETITSKKRKLLNHSGCYIAMERTIHNRLTKNRNFLTDIDLIIADEVHIQVFNKNFDLFPGTKVIGFTATPVVLKRDTFYKCEVCMSEYTEMSQCCGGGVMEWSRPLSLATLWDDIVCGPGIHSLIEMGSLVKEVSIVKKSVDTSKLKTDGSGEITEASQNHAFGSAESIEALVKDYEQICQGKKAMIFTGSTKVNKLLESAFINHNAKVFDTVNSTEDRGGVVDWFKNERDAILISTGIFTSGFDVPDVEAIIFYRSTMSLSLFIQITGRGARTTTKIYKDNFLLLDYGGNIERFGEFSDPTRDWLKIFYAGIGEARPKRESLEAVTQCGNCGSLYTSSQPGCPHCGIMSKPRKKREEVGDTYKLVPLSPMPSPSGSKLVEYAISQGQGAAFAFRVMTGQILDMFRYYGVDREQYERSMESGEFDLKVGDMIRKAYFVIIRSDLEGANRRLSSIVGKVKEKLKKHYESYS